jgi:hypothetical protein
MRFRSSSWRPFLIRAAAVIFGSLGDLNKKVLSRGAGGEKAFSSNGLLAEDFEGFSKD